MPLISDTRGVGRPVKQLNQAATRETIRFEHVLHGLVIGVGVGAHVAVVLQGPPDAVAGRVAHQTGCGDAVDGHIGVVVQPGAVDLA